MRRNIVSKSKKTNNWPSKRALEENRKNLIEELALKLNRYENRYELKSENLESAFKAGKIKDTEEICHWAMIYDVYKRLLNDR